MTFLLISIHYQLEFGGKRILSVNYLLCVTISRCLSFIPSSHTAMLALNSNISAPTANDSSGSCADSPFALYCQGGTDVAQDWRELKKQFGVTVIHDVEIARPFFCADLQPHDPFPLDSPWTYATTKLVNQINHEM
jgi:hypothetical protein